MSASSRLTLRWASRRNDAAADRSFHAFITGKPLTAGDTPFGLTDRQLIDLRGCPAQQMRVSGVVARNVDFSYGDFSSSWLEGNRFENCLFEKTCFKDFSDHGNMFRNCVFSRCNFRLGAIGYEGSRFVDCIFEECTFQRAVFIRAEFVNTDFIECKLRGVDFNGSSFEECRFEGIVEDVWFRGTFASESDFKEFGQPKGNKMLNVSFEKAQMVDLTISDGCDLSTIKLPRSGKYFRFDRWLSRLQCLERKLPDWDDEYKKHEASIFIRVALVHAQKQDWKVLNLDDLARTYGGPDVAAHLVETLIVC